MKVFISYSTRDDQIVALRLQTLAVVSMEGLEIYVPTAETRQAATGILTPEVVTKLQECDVVVSVIMHAPVASAVSEMNWALQAGKLLIPLVSPSVAPVYYQQFPYFLLNPNEPWRTEQQLVNFLREKGQEVNKPVVALLTLAIGLLLFGSLATESR
jgi:hypothetical protein